MRAAQRVQCQANARSRHCHQAACSQDSLSIMYFVHQKTGGLQTQWGATRPGHDQAGMRLCRCQVEAAGVRRNCTRAPSVSILCHSLQLCSQASNAVPWLPSLKSPAHDRKRAHMVRRQDCTLTRPPCRAAKRGCPMRLWQQQQKAHAQPATHLYCFSSQAVACMETR